MYKLKDLQSKSLKELKEIGGQLNVLPAGDRRCRQNWSDAIAGVNPPLLQLLEASPPEAQHPVIETVENAPGVEVEPAQEAPLASKFGRIVYPRQAQEAIVPAAKNSPGVEVEQAQEPIIETVETNPGAGLDRVQHTINQTWTSWEKEYCAWLKGAEWCVHKGENKRILAFLPVSKTLRLEGMEPGTEYCPIWEVSEPTFDFDGNPLPVCSSFYTQEPISPAAKNSLGVEVERVQDPIIETVETNPGVDVDRVQGAITLMAGDSSSCDWEDPEPPERSDYEFQEEYDERYKEWAAKAIQVEVIAPAAKTSLAVEVEQARNTIEHAVETSSGIDRDDDAPECCYCFDDEYIEDEFGCVTVCQCNKNPKFRRPKTQSAIAPAAKITDQNPSLRGVTLSNLFLARYSPPQAQIFHFKSDADGQLSLLDFKIESVDEPPDPDDFESLDAFREDLARWDAENPELPAVSCERAPCPAEWSEPKPEILPLKASSMLELLEQSEVIEFSISSVDNDADCCSVHSELNSVHSKPNSVHCEPPDPENFDSMFAFWAAYDAWVANDDPEPLEISLDSFCEWAPCPADWYEPADLLELPEVSELSAVPKSSITSDFFIPTFGRWSDRPDSDEPPDTWVFTKLPKPKPPTFPPTVANPLAYQPQVSLSQPQVSLSQPQVSLSQAKSVKPPTFPPKASWTQVGHNLDTTWTGIPKLSRNYPETIPKPSRRNIATHSTTQPARSPPGGDAMS